MRRSDPRLPRVIFVGFEVFWMQTLVDGLNTHCRGRAEFRWALWPSTWPERARFVRAMMQTDVVVRVGMPFEFESETNRLWLRWIASAKRVRGVNYWIGYDSFAYMRRLAVSGPTDPERQALSAIAHVAATENIAEALRASGVPAELMYFPSPDRPVPTQAPPLPHEFRAILYWRDETWEYSSGPELVAAARRLPGIRFDVLGSTGVGVPEPPDNLVFHGRVREMDPIYEGATVLVRMVEWDAVPGAMVEEALLFGRHVIYSFDFPNTVFVAHRDEEGLVAALSSMADDHARGQLGLNVAGREAMVAAWQPEARWRAMCDRLLREAEAARVLTSRLPAEDQDARSVKGSQDNGSSPAELPPEPVEPSGSGVPELRISAGSALSLAAKVIGLGTSFVVGVLVARVFGPDGKGTLSLVMQVPGLLVVVLDLGISTSIIYYVSRGALRPQTAAGNSLMLAGVMGILGAPVIYVLLAGPAALAPRLPVATVAIAIAILPLGLVASWLASISVGLSNLSLPLRYVVSSSLTTLLGLGVLLLTGNGSLTGVLAVSVAGTVTGIGAYVWGLRRAITPLSTDLGQARSMAGFSAKAYLSGLAGLLHERQDVLLLGWLAGTSAVGLYSVGVSFAEMAWYIPGALGAAILAKGGRRDEASAVDYTTRTVRVGVAFMLVTLAVSALVIPAIIPLVYGARFAPAAFAFLALMPGIFADGVSRILWSYQITRGRIYWRMAVSTMALNVAAVLVLAPRYGAVGAALASSLSYSLLAVLVVRRFCADTGVGVGDVLVPQSADIHIIARTLKQMVVRTR